MLRTSDGLTSAGYGLVKRLKMNDAKHFDAEVADDLIEHGFASVLPETGKLSATKKGLAVKFITRPA